MTAHVLVSGQEAGYFRQRYMEKLSDKPGDCGMDLFPAMANAGDYGWVDHGRHTLLSIPTHVRLLIPDGHFAWIVGRSSSYEKLFLSDILPGIIDAGYTGEYRVRIKCDIDMAPVVAAVCFDMAVKRQALAQAIIIPFARAHMVQVEELPATARGTNGYGSTDRKVVP